jgi:membrane protein implicated in regulation of membrane protease activity
MPSPQRHELKARAAGEISMGQPSSWIWKSLLASALIALAVGGGFYLFFQAHRELDIQPGVAWRISGLTFVLSAIVTMIYFRMRTGR